MSQLTKSVGKGVSTPPRDRDVLLVQQLLNKHRMPTAAALAEDGTIGPKTIAAIEEFQRRVVKMSNPDGRVDPNGATLRALAGQTPALSVNPLGWNLQKAVQHLSSHASATSLGKCAQYVRQAIEAGGVTLVRTESAKDYGSSLTRVGFRVVTTTIYQKGDVVIIQGFTGHPHGHMQMFDGVRWISDFTQKDFWPGPDYRTKKPSFTVYRFAILGDFQSPSAASRYA